jgi:hypothetical protein
MLSSFNEAFGLSQLRSGRYHHRPGTPPRLLSLLFAPAGILKGVVLKLSVQEDSLDRIRKIGEITCRKGHAARQDSRKPPLPQLLAGSYQSRFGLLALSPNDLRTVLHYRSKFPKRQQVAF